MDKKKTCKGGGCLGFTDDRGEEDGCPAVEAGQVDLSHCPRTAGLVRMSESGVLVSVTWT